MASSLRHRALIWVAVLVAAGIALALWLIGEDFYTTHPWDRPAHVDYDALRSAGPWGHGLGLAGAALILINLTFLLRRRVKAMRRFGALRLWMNMHVVTGLLGPLLIVYHTTFHPRSLVATISFACLGLLVLTGIIGRFIYAMIPHTVAGGEMTLAQLQARSAEAHARLEASLRADDPLRTLIEAARRPPRVSPKSVVGSLLLLPYSWTAGTWHGLRVWSSARHASADLAWEDVRDAALLPRRQHTLGLYRQLLRAWRGLHRWTALVMIATMIVHVVVALFYGYMPGQDGP